MASFRILSAFGPDQPGIVRQVAGFVAEHGCNIEDSRMAVLGGQFALMTLVSGAGEDLERLAAEVAGFQDSSGLKVVLVPAQDPRQLQVAPALPVRLELVAMDAPGILVRIAEVLERHQVNVENLESHLFPAPASGTTVSSVKMKVSVPQQVNLNTVKDDLNTLASEINVDILFQPVHE
ncbi:MAG: hypothetical protein DRI34_09065 [Deltaproteobacteria bacterium]|nr:MAG: hypothetical protein DRI34_09065 [Deltaproteobacteria bacterium]